MVDSRETINRSTGDGADAVTPKVIATRYFREREARGHRLRGAIMAIMATLPESPRPTAKRVFKQLKQSDLGRDTLPSERTVQWHMWQVNRHQSLRKLSLLLRAMSMHDSDYANPEEQIVSSASAGKKPSSPSLRQPTPTCAG